MAKVVYLGEEGLKALIAKVKALEWKTEVVDTLPETGEERILYLVPVESNDSRNLFDEYIWKADTSEYELLSSATLEIDLENYAKKSDFNSLKDYLDGVQQRVAALEESVVTEVGAEGADELTLSATREGGKVTVSGSVNLTAYQKSADITELTEDDVQSIWDSVEAGS